MKLYKYIIVFVASIFVLSSCSDEEFKPKPRGFYRIEFPTHNYTLFKENNYPYQFEYPTYGNIIRDTSFFGDKPENPCWMNIDFSGLGGKIYLTYKEIKDKNTLQKLLEDNYKMSYAHNKKADYIDDAPYTTPNNVSGLLSHIGGDAASSYQFFATDSNKHFLRGALYFDAVPNADSLKPVTEFLRKDLIKLINTIQFKK